MTMQTIPDSARLKRRVLEVAITAGGDTGGLLAAVANPFGVPVVIRGWIVKLTVASGGAATADLGVAANGTTLSDTLGDGLDINTTDTNNDIDNKGSNGASARSWSTSQFVTMSIATGTDGAVAGRLLIFVDIGI